MPGVVDQGLVQWLKSPALYTSISNTLPSGLNAAAIESEIISPLLTKAAADAELVRQLTVLGGPLVADRHVVKGQRRDLVGKPITMQGEFLGYDAGYAVFVIEAEELDNNVTALTVLRKLV